MLALDRSQIIALGRSTCLLASLSWCLTSCAGFHAAQPIDDEQILFKINDNTNASAFGSAPTPMPLGQLPPGSPRGRAPTIAQSLSGTRLVIQGVPPTRISAAVDGQVDLADLTVPPYQNAGRFFFGFPDGSQYACTGQLVGSDGVMLTAGHCVWSQDLGKWLNSGLFELRYNNATASQTLDWECAATFSGWVNGRYAYDYAFVKLRGVSPAGNGLQANVGPAHVDALGYPVNYYNASQMVHVSGNKDGNNPNAMPSTMSHGSSGGGWYLPSNNAVSLNSFNYTNDPNHMYGPSFTASTIRLYEFVSSGCTSQSRAIGMGNSVSVKALANSKTALAMTPQVEALRTESFLRHDIDSSVCPVGDRNRLSVSNGLKGDRLVGVETITVDANGKRSVSNDFVLAKAGSTTSLGCSNEQVGQGLSNKTIKIIYQRRVDGAAPAMPNAKDVSIVLGLEAEDVANCVPACAASDPAKCLNLGLGAINILSPLASFLGSAQSASSAPDGRVIAKADIITAYGGDPTKDADPCLRGDINRDGNDLTNDGLSCLTRAQNQYGGASALTVRLIMPSTARGAPSSWQPALAALTGQPTVYFQNAVVAPTIEFDGTNAATYNPQAAGSVHAISQISSNQIVVSTDNGCIQGYYKK